MMLPISNILKPGAKLIARKLGRRDPEVARLIKYTKQEQSKILKLKQIDHERLKNTLIVI